MYFPFSETKRFPLDRTRVSSISHSSSRKRDGSVCSQPTRRNIRLGFERRNSIRPLRRGRPIILQRRSRADFRRSRDISVRKRARGEPEPETVNHRTKLTPSPLRARYAGALREPRRRPTNRFMDQPPLRNSDPLLNLTLALSFYSHPLSRSFSVRSSSSCEPSSLENILSRERCIDFFINNRPPGHPHAR